MTNNVQLAAILAALLQFILVFELVRRKRMQERYALLWIAASAVVAVLATWTDLLGVFADFMGIKTPSNALFVAAFAFVMLLLLHFSIVVSRLSDQTVVLAQRIALLQQSLDAMGGVSRAKPEEIAAVELGDATRAGGAEAPGDG